MKKIYLDIMENALSAYTPARIRKYVDEVKTSGLKEHGFPRLGANIGILLAHGRCTSLKGLFVEIINLCISGFPRPADTCSKAGNNFAIREVCQALLELEKTDVIDKKQLSIWKEKLAAMSPSELYTHIVSKENPHPANWAYFAVVSEQAREKLCGIDATGFLEHQLPSQLIRLDENCMYRDRDDCVTGPHQPIAYDMVARNLLGLSLFLGYKGKYAAEIERVLDASDELTLKMQSVTGELAFGGRSNQCIHNEMLQANYYELRATLLNQKGERELAEQFKAAAQKATQACMYWLSKKPLSHVKNHFDPDLQLGCEGYSYFNKYMITVASHAYLAYLVADDSIKPSVAPVDRDFYVAETGADFHKVFLSAGGYFLEIDSNGDCHYDAGGLGRVHKKGCDPRVCLSVPFPDEKAHYKLETPNRHPLSICCFKNTPDGLVTAANKGVKHILKTKSKAEDTVSASFECALNDKLLFNAKYTASQKGVDLAFDGADGILVPVFLFDGVLETEICASKGQITVKYNGSFCKYTFEGEAQEYGVFFNRNGRYRAYKIEANRLHIEMGAVNEL